MKGLGRILAYLKPYKKYAILNIIGNILSVLFGLVTYIVVGKVVGILFSQPEKTKTIAEVKLPEKLDFLSNLKFQFEKLFSDYFLSLPKEEAIVYVSFAIIISFFFKALFAYMAQYFMAPIRSNLLRDIRTNLHNKIMNLPIKYFSEKRKGDLITRITTDVTEIEWSVISALELLVRDPFTIISAIALMIFYSWKLTLFVFIFLPISGYIVGAVGKKLKQHSDEGQKQVSLLVSLLEEHLSGLKIIKAFNAEEHAHTVFTKENETFTQINNRIKRRQDMASPMSEFLGSIIITTVFWYGGNLIFEGDADSLAPDAFITYIMLFWQLLAPSKNISRAYMNVKKGTASIDRILAVLDAPDEEEKSTEKLRLPNFEKDIEFRDVSFSYEENKQVLSNISFTLNKGETIALVGQSGSGKSTIADLVARFYTVEKGEISIDGLALNDIQLSDIRSKMGIITQDSILFNDSVANNLMLGKENVSEEKIIEAAKLANAHEFIMNLPNGYQTNIGDGGGKLSGGQKQRLSIARALLSNPDILIMDEATSALDTESEKLVQDAINKLLTNRTSIIIAHRLSTIIGADKIIVLHEGKIVESGTHQELLAMNGYYTKLHEMQDISNA
jgi:subfamily B ATP-binding cassette protein MsbA